MKIRRTLLVMFMAAVVFFTLPSPSRAEGSPVEVIIQVDEEGFRDSEGRSFGNRIEVPEGRAIKLIFEHVGKPGVEHAFVLLFDSDEEIESGTISTVHKRTHIEFKTGDAGETYDVFCVIVDCDGMEHLTDLVIVAT
ncbi:MAG: hypothetical protein ABGX83_01090 [Nitrospira sp.]|nr:hypothetical protein [Candidatus Manganitrophaceae bacterium]HIL35150.1 hypothetical protein [Candidatus Manganitrophaceae bacterium]